MKNVIFSEKKQIENILITRDVSPSNVIFVINSLAKYNFGTQTLDDKDNYQAIVAWLRKNYPGFVETNYSQIILDSISKAKEYKMMYSDNIIIYKSELDIITSVNDIKKEKFLFVALCVAKLQANIYGYQNGKYKEVLTNMFKMARVHIPSKDRNSFMYDLRQLGYIDVPFTVDGVERYVKFISNGENDEQVMELNEVDFLELAYQYLNWKDGEGFDKCAACGRLIKHKPNKICCEECDKETHNDTLHSSYKPVGNKTVTCIDCGKEFQVPALNTRTYRCKDCDKKAHNELVKASYEPVGNKTVICIDCGKEFQVSALNTKTRRCDKCQHLKQLEYQRSSMAKLRTTM